MERLNQDSCTEVVLGQGLRVGQLNVQRSSVCLDDLRMIVRDRRLDVVLLQEPYSRQGRLPHLGSWRLYYVPERPMAAVAVVNERVEVLFIREVSTSHHVCLKIVYGDEEMYLVSSYFQYSEEMEPHIRKWEECVTVLGHAAFVLAGDVNAKSTIWHNEIDDDRGLELEAFLEAKNLIVTNVVRRGTW